MLMKRVIKLEGKGNIAIEEIEIPVLPATRRW